MAAQLRPGDPSYIGRYRTLSRLGEGGMGSVFLAQAPGGRLVAVKVIRPEYAHEEEFRARFRSEVSRAREVPPFCTAEVLDADPDSITPYLVVEYVDGPSLSEVVAENGPLGGGSLHGVAVGVAAALAAIHGAGVIHRDLKPRNVLFALGTPKVIDFGIARPLEATSYHTRPDMVVGTLAYMAPERLDAESDRLLTPAVDVFAWGGVVAYAGAGRTPFGGDSPAVTAARILTQPPRVAGLPPYLTELVTASLEKDPANRPTAPELLERLLVSGSAATPPLPAELRREAEAAAAAKPRPARRRVGRVRRVAVVAAAVTAVAALTGTGLRLLDSSDPAPAPVSGPGASAPAPAAAGPSVFDSLQRYAMFSETSNDDGTCGYRGGLRIRTTTSMVCAPDSTLIFPPDQSVSVRATLAGPQSCATVSFRATKEDEGLDYLADAYRVAVCPGEVRLSRSIDGGETVIATEKRRTTTGAAHRIELLTDSRQATVAVDGERVLGGPLTESSLISGRVMLGASTTTEGRRADVTFTDAQLRSGSDPAVPAVPAFVSGNARFSAGTYLTYDIGRMAVVEPTEFLTGAEYCRRFALDSTSPQCGPKYVPAPSSTRVSLPIAESRVYLDYRQDPDKCLDTRTRAGTCKVSFEQFATDSGPDPRPAMVTVRDGKVVAIATLSVR
ncbi:serine/threonine protein kinase [Actinoplanes sp. TRM 88003]|uniref:Serine/threonine protein kinase n=1 Tax=Paractinoplanes aksuensis TaxID=2939490 RepID=A0ABT1DEG1_9ACTN|nr:serine/threonine-protein kinase [Actinoplanes aksuensis]MCO8269198.1 serine/threonine protein kinase [Actinoplanes aksuensis]